MKRNSFILCTIIFSLLMIIPVFAYSKTSKYIISENISTFLSDNKNNKIEITGSLPQLKNTNYLVLEESINSKIKSFAEDIITNAQKSKFTRKINFRFTQPSTDSAQLSVLISASVTSSTTKNHEFAFTVDAKNGNHLAVNDILGPNGVTIANTIIKNSIANNPDRYDISEKVTIDNKNFYMQNYQLKLLYGNYTFPIKKGNIKNLTLYEANNDYYSKETHLKMIPLRKVCQEFDYQVVWNNETNSIDIKKGTFITSVTADKNSYFIDKSKPRNLESAPVWDKQNGITYVPISFFEQILNLFYTVEGDRITFSSYRT